MTNLFGIFINIENLVDFICSASHAGHIMFNTKTECDVTTNVRLLQQISLHFFK